MEPKSSQFLPVKVTITHLKKYRFWKFVSGWEDGRNTDKMSLSSPCNSLSNHDWNSPQQSYSKKLDGPSKQQYLNVPKTAQVGLWKTSGASKSPWTVLNNKHPWLWNIRSSLSHISASFTNAHKQSWCRSIRTCLPYNTEWSKQPLADCAYGQTFSSAWHGLESSMTPLVVMP